MNSLVTGLVKVAFATYNYQASASRNFFPKPVKEPRMKANEDWKQEKINLSKRKLDGQLPWGVNKPVHIFDNPTMRPRTALTISGTGSGQQYWSPIDNPFNQ